MSIDVAGALADPGSQGGRYRGLLDPVGYRVRAKPRTRLVVRRTPDGITLRDTAGNEGSGPTYLDALRALSG